MNTTKTDVHYFLSGMIAKYEKYIANLEWTLYVYRPSIPEEEKIIEQIYDYREVLKDLKLLSRV